MISFTLQEKFRVFRNIASPSSLNDSLQVLLLCCSLEISNARKVIKLKALDSNRFSIGSEVQLEQTVNTGIDEFEDCTAVCLTFNK